MLKNSLITFIFLQFSLLLSAQQERSAFHFLQLPYSSHASALGGENVSIIADDLAMSIQNPALLTNVSNKSLLLNYMYYMRGVNVAGAAYTQTLKERSNWGVSAQYIDYGSFKETNIDNTLSGTFTAKDITLSALYSYALSNTWSGGVRTNFIYSHYDIYNSFAIGFDLGLNYYNEAKDFSFSIVAKNLGGQLKTFEEQREKMPVNLLLGISKDMTHAPFRFSLTLHDLTHWSSSLSEVKGWGEKFLSHIALGIDYLPTGNTYIALGYNFRRGQEMKVSGSNHWAGITAGAGIQLKRFKIGLNYAKLHVSASSLQFNLAYTLL